MQGWTGTAEYPWAQGRWIWINALRPYYSDPKMRLCPMAAKFILDESGNDTGARPPYAAYGIINRGDEYAYINGDYTSYMINWWVNRCPPGFSVTWGEERQFWKNTDVRGAGNIPVFGDGSFWLARPNHTDSPPDYDGQWNWADAPGTMGMKRIMVNRHDGFTNWLFMDWSIRKMGLKQAYTYKWSRTFDTGGIWTAAGGLRSSDWPPWMRKFKEYY